MNKTFAFALAAAAFAITSAPAEARDYCHAPSYGYRTSYRRVVIVEPVHGWRSNHHYYRPSHRNRYEDRHNYHHHKHGVRGFIHRVFR
jgi:hypothetical protein